MKTEELVITHELKKLGCTKMIIGCLDGNPSNEYYKHIGHDWLFGVNINNEGGLLK